MSFVEAIVDVLAVASVVLAAVASMHVFRARETPGRTAAQLAFVWLVPIIGALLTMQIHRREPERHGPAETDDPGIVEGKIDQRPAVYRSSRSERRDEIEPSSVPESTPDPE